MYTLLSSLVFFPPCLFSDSISKRVKSGTSILFWSDIWLGSCVFPRLFFISEDKDSTIANMGRWVKTSGIGIRRIFFRRASNTLFKVFFSTHSYLLVKMHLGLTTLWMGLLNSMWGPHDLVGLMCISTNQWEYVGKSVLESILLAFLFFFFSWEEVLAAELQQLVVVIPSNEENDLWIWKEGL